jgi:hypothetical protein
MAQPNDLMPIGWYIDRNPDHNIINNIRNYRNTSLANVNNNYNSWSPDSINYNIIHDNINNNIRSINSPWINDPSYQNSSTISRIRINRSRNRYFNHINTFSYNNSINNNRNAETSTNINSNEDFIPFDNSQPQNNGINIDIINFTVSEEDRQCCICMEERQSEEICRLNCQHSFCVQCINQHLQTNHSCPICRSSVTTLTVQNNNARDRINL